MIIPDVALRNDSSKLDDFMRCPRLYFYRHICGWQSGTPGHDRIVGGSVHKGQEQIYLEGINPSYNELSAKNAYQAFLKEYRKTFSKEEDSGHYPKSPQDVEKMFQQYVEYYKDESPKEDVLYNEIAGSVYIDHRRIYFRMDTIINHKTLGFISREHKTTGEKGFSRFWIDQFVMSIQVSTYNHVLYCLHDPKLVGGVQINGLSFMRKREDKFLEDPGKLFKRLLFKRSPDQMAQWVWNVREKFDRIEQEITRLNCSCTEDDQVMKAFPLRENSCTDFFGCPYLDFCAAWSNPLRHLENPPPKFIKEYWDPLKLVKEAKHTFDVKV